MTTSKSSFPAGRFDLERFMAAQAPVFEEVCAELSAGKKRGHWMWFIFPQLRGLGHSAMADKYGISSLAEASAYLQHAVLGPRLIRCTELVKQIEGKTAYQIFSSPDDVKLRSCLTLFSEIDGAPEVFAQGLTKYFGGEPDGLTLRLLKSA